MKIHFPSHLTDAALVAEVLRLAGREREAKVQLVTYLAEFDRRRLFLPAGYASLYPHEADLDFGSRPTEGLSGRRVRSMA